MKLFRLQLALLLFACVPLAAQVVVPGSGPAVPTPLPGSRTAVVPSSCPGTDKVIGITATGTLICGADIAAGGGAHVLADTTGLGANHTTSGLTAGQVLRASGATTAAFAVLPIGDTSGDLAASRVDDGAAASTQALFSGAGGAAGFRAIADADVPNTITIDLATLATTANAGDSATAFFSAGALELAIGGTNQTAWTASRCVQVNAGGTALESAAAACGAGGSGDSIEIEQGDNTGVFDAIDTTARLDDAGDLNFVFADGGAGGPDTVTAEIRAGAVTDAEVNASGITTRSKLPSALAYEDEANVFTAAGGLTLDNQLELRLREGDAGGDQFLGLRAKAAITTSRTLTLNLPESGNCTGTNGGALTILTDEIVCSDDDSGAGGGDSITVATVAATDPDFIDSGRIDFTLDTAATPDTITADIVANSVTATHLDETVAYAFSSGTNTFKGASYTSAAADPADGGILRTGNNENAWCAELATPGTDKCVKLNASDQFEFSASLVVTAGGTDAITLGSGTNLSSWGHSSLVFEGSGDDGFETTISITNPTADRTVTVPDAASTTVQSDAGAANNFLTAISAAGVISKAQPDFSNLSGTVSDTQIAAAAVDGGTGGEIADASITSADLIAANKTFTKSLTIFDPATGDSNDVQMYFAQAITITRVACSVAAATSVTIQLDERAEATPNTAGVDVMTSTLVCDTDSQATTSFTNAGIALRVPLNLQITAVSGTPGSVRVHIEYTVD